MKLEQGGEAVNARHTSIIERKQYGQPVGTGTSGWSILRALFSGNEDLGLVEMVGLRMREAGVMAFFGKLGMGPTGTSG